MKFKLKKIDLYMLLNFLGLLGATLFICIFVLMMQFLWLHITDLVGKGVELSVLAEFFLYAVATVVPLALPLAILLASLITFGNLGEKFELTAMKAAGISLFRIMRPLTIAISMVCVGAFFFSNNVLPKAQTRLWALIFSLREKSPELDIPVGEFYSGIDGYNIYVRGKNRQNMLFNVMLYNYSDGFQNAQVIVADSAQLFITADKKHLRLCLHSGESFENLKQENRKKSTQRNIPYRRETFAEKQLLIDFDTDLSRYDESVFDDQHVSKDVSQLLHSIDSVKEIAHQQSREQSDKLISGSYFGRERREGLILPEVDITSPKHYDIDSLRRSMSLSKQESIYKTAIENAQSYRDKVDYNAILLGDSQRYIRKHAVELHRKFTLAFACLIFFFIGAPLGAIIRKGGLGAPVVISVVMFIVYYIIDNTGYKMAREALWPVWRGMWLSSMVLLPIGIFLTYKAATDSPLFTPEAWGRILKRLGKRILFVVRTWRWRRNLHVQMERLKNKQTKKLKKQINNKITCKLTLLRKH